MSKSVHTKAIIVCGIELDVTYIYTPAQPASNPDGEGGPMLDPPVEESVEVLDVHIADEFELTELIMEDYREELIEEAIMDGE